MPEKGGNSPGQSRRYTQVSRARLSAASRLTPAHITEAAHEPLDDIKQVGGGMYGAFIVDPRPGSVYPFHCHILSHLMNPGQSSGEMGGLIVLLKYAS